MTELEAKAKDCIENHTHKLVDKPTKQDIYLREESIFISGYKLGATEATKELQEQIEKMKNCKNCANYMISGKCPCFFRTGWCKNWEMTRSKI